METYEDLLEADLANDGRQRTKRPYKDIFDAAMADDDEAVRSYIEKQGVRPNSVNNHERTAAHIAARKGNLKLVKYLLELDRSILDQYRGEEVFMLAIEYGRMDVVKYLVEEVKFPIEKRFTNRYYGNTAIHFAAQYEEQEIMKYFLEERNGNVEVLNDVEQTPLFEAVENRCHPMVKYLIEERNANVHHLDYMRDTIMDKAVKKEDYVMLKYLINERKMPVDVKWRNEQTHMAASFGSLSLMQFLVNELHTDVNCADEWGKTPLHKAAWDNCYEVCQYLLDHGANPNLRDLTGVTPVDETTWENVTALLKAAASASRNRRSVFEPVHLTGSTRDAPKYHHRLRLEADHGHETPQNIGPAFQNFLLMARVGFRNVDRRMPPRIEETYDDRHFAHLAVEAALQDRGFGGA